MNLLEHRTKFFHLFNVFQKVGIYRADFVGYWIFSFVFKIIWHSGHLSFFQLNFLTRFVALGVKSEQGVWHGRIRTLVEDHLCLVPKIKWFLLSIAPTKRPKSVRNHCVIERSVVSLCYFTYALSVVKGCLSYDWIRPLPFSLKNKAKT